MSECPLTNPTKIRKIFPSSETVSASVVNLRNCLSMYIDFGDLNTSIDTMKPKSVEYKYYNVDSITFEESKVYTSKAYQCRLYGISIANKIHYMNKLQKHESNISNIKIHNTILMTSGNFKCIIYGVDMEDNLVVELVDPITNDNIGSNMLDKYPKTFRRYKEIM